jgi:hypothetical protein
MNGQLQISDFVLAVCHAMTTIDEMFFGIVDGWFPLREGFNIEVKDRSQVHGAVDKIAFVYPLEWPKESYVACRIMQLNGVWGCEEGTICVSHIEAFKIGLSFKFYRATPSFIVPKDEGQTEEIVRRAARKRCPDLVGKGFGF